MTANALAALDTCEADVLTAAAALLDTTPPPSRLTDEDEAFYTAWYRLRDAADRIEQLTHQIGDVA